MRNIAFTCGLSLALLAGSAWSAGIAMAQNTPPEVARDSAPRTQRGQTDFRSAEWLADRKIVNDNGDEVADLENFIIDRGSGRIRYAVISTGSILGLGGRKVAISYPSLRWSDTDELFRLPLTTEQIKQFPEFSEKSWKGLGEPADEHEENLLRSRLMQDSEVWSRDPYASSLEGAKEVRVRGEITAVSREEPGDYGEEVVLTVRTDDGATRRVALGPSWFVNSGAAAPMRGDKVTIDALALPRDPEQTLVARTVTFGDNQVVQLRTQDRKPAWIVSTEKTDRPPAGDQASYAARRYVLMSDLDGAGVQCRGKDCGKVNDLVIERNSGTVALISIDPNENFLGIGDTKRLVPWNVASVAPDGKVRIDASKQMVLSSPETPKDLSTLNSGGMVDLAYRTYEVKVPRFEPPPESERAVRPPSDAWSRDGAICKALMKDSTKQIDGKLGEMRQVSLGADIPDASAVIVEHNGQHDLVLLGPSWYIKNQKLACDRNSDVSVETCRTTIAGKDYLIARWIECGGARTVLMNDQGPAWDRR